MKGLLTKEFIMLRKNWLVMFLFAGVFGVIGIISGFPSMLLLVSLFITIYQLNHITVDEQCKWQQYAIALPYGRRNIISSKYIYIQRLFHFVQLYMFQYAIQFQQLSK